MRPRVDGKLLPDFPDSLMKKRIPRNVMFGVAENEKALLRKLFYTTVFLDTM